MNLNKLNKFSFVGLVSCFGLLGLFTIAMLCPLASKGASAADETEIATQANLYVQPVISIALQSKVNVEVTPKSTGASSTATADLKVSTNNGAGYKVYIKSNDPNMVATDKTNTSKITPISGETTLAGFGANTWGYALGLDAPTTSTTYKPVPTTQGNAALDVPNKTVSGTYEPTDNYKLTFGTMINTALPAGEYSSSVIVSAVANPMTVTSLTQLTYMQDMTHDICRNTGLHASKRLIDMRDGNAYWVTRLADGNCWMTQNLALDLDPAHPLTADLTDLKSGQTSFAAEAATSNEIPEKVSNPSQTTTYSWNLGKYVLADPEDGTLCTSKDGADQYDSVMHGGSLDECRGVGFINVENPIWEPTYVAQNGSWTNTHWVKQGDGTFKEETIVKDNTLVAVDEATYQYDAHYLIGNYYQFNTATAGNGGEGVGNANVQGSICPKNWHLPLSGAGANGTLNNNDNNGSFMQLLKWYGLTTQVTGTGTGVNTGNYGLGVDFNGNALSGGQIYTASGQVTGAGTSTGFTSAENALVNGQSYNIAGAPLHFVRSGNVNRFVGSARYLGIYGYNWSTTSSPVYYNGSAGLTGYYLDFYASGVNPSYGPYDRWNGFPVRCLAY